MGIMRNIIDWCDKKMESAYEDTDDRRAGGKAFMSGAVEGFSAAIRIEEVRMEKAQKECESIDWNEYYANT